MAVPDRRVYTPNAMCGDTIAWWPTCGVPDPFSRAQVAVERAGNSLILAHFSDTFPVLLPLFAS